MKDAPATTAPRARQLTFAERLEALTQRAAMADPRQPARAVLGCVLALMATASR